MLEQWAHVWDRCGRTLPFATLDDGWVAFVGEAWRDMEGKMHAFWFLEAFYEWPRLGRQENLRPIS